MINPVTIQGLRAVTSATVASRLAAAGFEGLPGGVGRCDLMRAIEAGGRGCGFSRNEVRRLVYLVRHTWEIDWQGEDGLPVVWKSVEAMAEDLAVSRQQVNAVERSLAGKGAIAHRDSASRRRWGERDPGTGRVTRAYGVDLRPLAGLYDEFLAAARAVEDERRAKKAVREDSAALRVEIRQLAAALGRETGLDWWPLKADASLAALVAERDRVRAMRDALVSEIPGGGGGSASGNADVGGESGSVENHKGVRVVSERGDPPPPAGGEGKAADRAGECSLPPERNLTAPPIPLQTDSRVPEGNRPARSAGGADPSGETSPGDPNSSAGDNGPGRNTIDPDLDFGVQHLQPDRVAAVASDLWRREAEGQGWRGNRWACEVVRQELGIHDRAWHLALRVLGIRATVVLVAIIDGRCQDKATFVWNPSGFVVGCVKRAEAGGLHLHRSIWGLERQRRWRDSSWCYADAVPAGGAA